MVGAKILANEAQMQYLATIWRLPISTDCAEIFFEMLEFMLYNISEELTSNVNLGW